MVAIVSGNGLGLSNSSGSVLGQQGVFGNAVLGSAKERAYVNIANGNLVLQDQDDFVAAWGVKLDLTRTYNAQGNYNDGNGASWRLGLIRQLVDLTGTVNTGGSTITRIGADGSRQLFRYDTSLKHYISTDGTGAYQHLSADANQNWTWTDTRTDMNGAYETYGTLANGGRIQSSGDEWQVRLNFSYDANGHLSQVTDASWGKTNFDYDAKGNLSQIRTTDLSDVTRTRTHYTYDTLNRLTQVSTDLSPDDNSIADGKVYTTTYTYFAATNEIASVTQGDGTYLEFAYVQVGGAWKVDAVTDGLGQVTKYTYDGQKTTVTDPLGNSTVYTYDSNGQLLSVTEPATLLNGSVVPGAVTAFSYDASGNLKTITDARGKLTQYEYDANGNRIKETNPDGDTILRQYNAASNGATTGNLLSFETTASGKTSYFYDAKNRLQFTVSPTGMVTERQYDTTGLLSNVLEYTDARLPDAPWSTSSVYNWTRGTNVADTTVKHTDYEQDFFGLTSKVSTYTTRNGASTTVELPATPPTGISNSNGALTFTSTNQPTATKVGITGTQSLPMGSALQFKITVPAATGANMLSVGLDSMPSNNDHLRLVFDKGTLRLYSQSPVYGSGYVPLGNISPGRVYTVNIATSPDGWVRITLQYPQGPVISTGRANFATGASFRFAAETASGPQNGGATPGSSVAITVSGISARMPVVATSTVETTQYVHDQHGQLLQTIDGNNKTSASFAYDGLGRMISATDADNNFTTTVYDDAGGRRSVTLANGLVTQSTFDKAGRLTSTSQFDKNGQVLGVFSNSYDQSGRLRQSVAADGSSQYFLYDAAGRQTAKIDANGNVTALYYNANNQVTRTTQFSQPIANSLLQAVNGVWPQLTLADLRLSANTGNRSTWNLYDDSGRLSKTVDGNGALTQYVYDHAGNLTQKIQRAITIDTVTLATVYIPASFGESVSPNDQITHYYYNSVGQLEIEVDPARYATFHTYNVQGQRIATTRYDTPVPAMYFTQAIPIGASDIIDFVGQPISRERFFYNGQGRLAGTLDNGNYLTTLSYDLNGNLISRRHYAVAVTTPTGAHLGDLGYATNSADLVTSYTYTARNQVETETGPDGVVTRYTYDKLGKLIETRVGAGTALAHSRRYDLQGNLVAELNADGVAALASATPDQVEAIWRDYGMRYTYNANGLRLSTIDQRGNETRYYYDPQGNLRYTVNAAGEVSGMSYNSFNQLSSVTRYATRIDGATLASLHGGQNDLSINGVITRLAAPALDSVQRYEYDQDGRQSAVIDALGNRSTTHYNAFGQVDATEQQSTANANVSAPASNGGSRSFYDVDGRLKATLSASGSLTAYTYNALHQLTDRITFAKAVNYAISATELDTLLFAPAQRDIAHDRHLRYFYDARGLLSAQLQAEDVVNNVQQWSVIKMDYDGNGNLSRRTAYATRLAGSADTLSLPPDSAFDSVAVYTYDSANRLAATATAQNTPDPLKPTQRNWSVVRNSYDALGNLKTVTAYDQALPGDAPTAAQLRDFTPTSPANAVTSYTYDSQNRIKTVAVAQNSATGKIQWAVSERRYDAAGNLSATIEYATPALTDTSTVAPGTPATSPTDRTTLMGYDAANRLSDSTDAVGTITQLEYDAKGNIIRRTVRNASGTEQRTSRTVYDLDGRPQYDIDAAGNVTERRYDAQGNLSTLVQYATPVKVELVTALADSVSSQLRTTSADNRSTKYFYDQNHRLRFTVDARGYLTENRYDNFGNLSDTLAYPIAPPKESESLATLSAALSTLGAPRTTHLEYDAQGHLVRLTDALGNTESYGYDALGRKTSFTNKLQQTWTYAYDNAGHLVLETSPQVDVYANGQLDVNPDVSTRTATKASLRTQMQYDMLGNLKTRTEGYGSDQPRVTNYDYDLAGRQIRIRKPAINVYNPNAVASAIGVAARNEVSSGELITEVSYDVLGNAISNKDVDGNMTYKIYDSAGRVRFDIDAAGYITGYERDGFGQVTTLTRYSKELDSSSLASFQSNAANRTIDFILRSIARPAPGTPSLDRVVVTRYDQLGQVIKVTEPLAWAYDQHALYGNSMIWSARTTDTRYDAFGQVRQVLVYGAGPLGRPLTQAASTRYFYDQGGNKKAQITTLQDDGVRSGYLTTYEYSAAGDLTKQTEYATQFSDWDADWTSTRYGKPSPSAQDRVTEITYDDNRRQTAVTREGNLSASYQYDKLGNTIAITDALGGKSFNYFDALGRTTATAKVAPSGQAVSPDPQQPKLPAAAPTPLSEFRRNLFGEVVVQIDYANGTPANTSAEVNPFNAAVKPVLDRERDHVTSTTYDAAGHAIQIFDAEGKAINSSYDKFGRVAKQWRTVSNSDNADRQQETSFVVTRYDVLGRVRQIEKPGNIDLIQLDTHHGDLTPRNTIQTNTYNAFGEVVQALTQAANQGSDDDWGNPLTRTEYAVYDNAGHAWLSVGSDGISKATLFDALGNVSSSIRGISPNNPANVRALLQQGGLQRTDYRFDLMGRQVDARTGTDAQLYVMVRDPVTSAWIKQPQLAGTQTGDSLLVVAEASDKGTPFQVQYRLQGSSAWIDGGDRLQVFGDNTAFSTQGLAAGAYEYQVMAQPAGEAAFQRAHGKLQIANLPSSDKNIALARVYAVVLNRAPDLAGLNFYVQRANTGVPLARLVMDFLGSTEAAPNLAGSSDEVMRRIFAYAFGRTGDSAAADPSYAADIAKWSAAYDAAKAAGGNAPGQVILDLIDSVVLPIDDYLPPANKAVLQKAQTRLNNRVTATLQYLMDKTNPGTDAYSAATIFDEAPNNFEQATKDAHDLAILDQKKLRIAQIYMTLFGRAAEAAAVATWTQSSLTPEQIASALLNMPEAKDPLLYPDNDLDENGYNAQLIAHAYQNMLGRPASSAELADWQGRLAAMGGSAAEKRGNFVMQLVTQVADYSGADSTLLTQKQAFNNRVSIALNFNRVAQDNVPAADQLGMNRALFAAVTSADNAILAAQRAETTLAAKATAAAATAAAARLAAGSTALEDMRAGMARLYVVLLNRTPDTAGLNYQIDALQRLGGDQAAWTTLANGFIASDESKADATLLHHTKVNGVDQPLTDAQFVQRIYQLALGQVPTSWAAQQEMQRFQQQLTASNRGEMAVKIINNLLSYPDLSAQDAALKATFNNKVGVALACAINLGPYNWGEAGHLAESRTTMSLVSATDTNAALDYAYGVARASVAQSAVAAATQAGANVASAANATKAWLQAKGGVDAATSAANAQASANLRLQVIQMYAGILGRTPDVVATNADLAGIESQIDALNRTDLTGIANQFITSGEGSKFYSAQMSNNAFVTQLFSNILGSNVATPTDIAYYANQIGGSKSRGSVALDILDYVKNYPTRAGLGASRTFLTARQAFYQRVADNFALIDAAQQAAASNAAQAMAGLRALGNSVAQQQSQYQQDVGARDRTRQNTTNALNNAYAAGSRNGARLLQLNLMYATLLQRTVQPKQEEFAYYLTGDGNVSLELVARDFIISKEARDRGLYPADDAGILGKLYSYILGRAPQQEETTYWLDQLRNYEPSLRLGKLAMNILNSYTNYTDSTASQLQHKLDFDQQVIAQFLTWETSDANAVSRNAYLTWQQRDNESRGANNDWKAAIDASQRAQTTVNKIAADVDKLYNYADRFKAAPPTYQSDITFLYMGLRNPNINEGKPDFPGLVFQMENARGFGEDFRTALIEGLLNEAGNGLSSDAIGFVVDMYRRICGLTVSRSDSRVITYANRINSSGNVRGARTQVASELLRTIDAKNNLNARVAQQVQADKKKAQDLIDERTQAGITLETAKTTESRLQGIADAAGRLATDAWGKYLAASDAWSAVSALNNAYGNVTAQDAAYLKAAQSYDTYTSLNTAYAQQQQALAPQALIDQNAATVTPADHAGAILAARLADLANADVVVANAYAADAGSPNASRQARIVTQLFAALVNRAPKVDELTYWSGKLGADLSAANQATLAQAIMDSGVTPLFPPAQSDKDFVTQLYQCSLSRGFDKDPDGLKFWTDKLSTGTPPMTRAQMVVAFTSSLPFINNSDSLTFDDKVGTALQALIAEGNNILANPNSLASGILQAELRARSAASSYDASAQAQAANNPLAKHFQPLTRLYLALLNRTPDVAGVSFWIDSIVNSMPPLTMENVAQNMLNAPESQQRYPAGTTDSDFLTQVFANAMGRPPRTSELTPFLAQVAGQGRGAAALHMINAIADAAANGDLLLAATRDEFNAKVSNSLSALAAGLTNQARYLSEAATVAHNLASTKLNERHVDGVVTGSVAVIQGGAMLAPRDTVTLDRWGNVVSRVDAQDPNWSVSYTYNHDNQLLSMTQMAKGGVTTKYAQVNTYDALGHVLTVTEGLDTATAGSGHTNRNYYDANGNLMREVHADGGVTDYQLDVFGHRLLVAQYTDVNNAVRTSYTYDRLGRQTSRSTAATPIAYWDKVTNRLISSSGVITDSYVYDELGRRIRSTNSNTAALGDPNNGLSTLTRYDLSGNIISVENGVPANRAANAQRKATLSAYDAFNHKFGQLDYGGTIAEMAQPGGAKNFHQWVYDEFGRLLNATDLGGNTTSYVYDTAGRMTFQGNPGAVWGTAQNLRYTYDTASGQLLQIEDRGLNQVTTYTYDHNGNRLTEKVWLTLQNRALQDNTLSYDHQGRLIDIVSTVPDADYYVHYDYDDYGNRLHVSTTFTNDYGDRKFIRADYTYDSMNRQLTVGGEVDTNYKTPHHNDNTNGDPDLSYYDNGPITSHSITYDWMGNRKTDNLESYEYDAAGRLATVKTNGAVTGQRGYDGTGQLINNTDKDGIHYNSYDALGHLTFQRNTDNRGNFISSINYTFDEAGNLDSYTVLGAGSKQLQRIQMEYGLKRDGYLLTKTTINNIYTSERKESGRHYDYNGHLAEVTEEDARTLLSDSAGRVLEKTQLGRRTHTLIANDQLIGTSSGTFESFSSVYDSADSPSVAAPPSVYVVQSASETLSSVAKMVWGDERLWYLLTDINAIASPDEKLSVGQPIRIPTRINTVLNGYQSFKPYNADAVVGSTTPELAMPQAPQQGHGGCGLVGQLISVFIAAAVTSFTGQAWLGSLASQAFNNLTGDQHGFSWKAAAMAQIGKAFSDSIKLPGDGGSSFSWQSDVPAAMARSAVVNLATQAVGSITHLQSGFNWTSVVASGIGGGVGEAMGDVLKDVNLFKDAQFSSIANASIQGFTSGVATAVARGGRIAVAQIATDAFGNALGQSLASSSINAESGESAQSSGTQGGLMSPRALERLNYGGLTAKSALGGDKDWLGTIGSYTGSLDTSSSSNAATFAQDLAWRSEQLAMFEAPIPSVSIVGNVYDRLAAAFNTSPEVIRTTLNASDDPIAHSNLVNSGFYSNRVANASNPITQELWHIAGIASESGHSALQSARGLYNIATDDSVRSAAVAGIQDTWNHLPRYVINGMQAFSGLPLSQKIDAGIKFGFDSAISAGAGKLAGWTGQLGYKGAAGGLKFLAENFDDFNGFNIGGIRYLAPIRLNVVPPGPRVSGWTDAIPDTSPYVTRYNPQFPGMPDPEFTIDTKTFTSGDTTMRYGIRNKSQFWKQWSDHVPDSLSAGNRSLISMGQAPIIDDNWLKVFPEHSAYLNDSLVHHHIDFGRYATPVPYSTHTSSSGIWHIERIRE